MKKILSCFLSLALLITSNYSGIQVLAETVAPSAAESQVVENSENGSTDVDPLPSEPEVKESETPESEAPKIEDSTPPPVESSEEPQLAEAPQMQAFALGETKEETKPFEISARTNLGELGGSLYSGESFNYYISYTVPPLSNIQDTYSEASISIEIPQHLSVAENGGVLEVGGNDVDYSYMETVGGKQYLNIFLVVPLTTGTAKDISIKLITENFGTPNGTEIKLAPVFTARAQGVYAVGEIPEAARPVVTVNADDGWTVKKTAEKLPADDNFYYTRYTIVAQNQQNSVDSDYNRYGRLAMEKFKLTDFLPTNTPAGGEAVDVSSFTIDGKPMDSTDYSVNSVNGKVESVEINKISPSGKLEYVAAGTPATTTYTFVAKYPRAPYITPSNIPMVNYTVTNNVKLDYQLLGEGDKSATASADVTFAEQEKVGVPADLKVAKYLQIGGDKYKYTSADAAHTVSFGLYFDTECTKPATSIDGKTVVGAPIAVNSDGEVTFANLRPGDYFLKETVTAVGVDPITDSIPVKVTTTGPVYSGANSAVAVENGGLSVTNTTGTLGIVSFTKYGTDAEGKTAALADCEFKLESKADKSIYFTARSDTAGTVTFMYVPAGAYTLSETSSKDTQYTDLSKTFDVTVEGNKTIEPTLDDVGGENGFLNTSAKGKLALKKIDKNSSALLPGAEFKVYGPYGDTVTDIPVGAAAVDTLTTNENGIAVSQPLTGGKYFIKESKAPEKYSISDEVKAVTVVPNSITDPEASIFKDELQFEFSILKIGVTGNPEYEEALPGVTFQVFKADGTRIGEVTTALDATNNAVTPPLYLDRGDYYYVETKTAPGYTLDTQKHNFSIPLKDGATRITAKNYTDLGRLKIIKKDSADETKLLPGATFKVYSNELCTEEYLKATLVTDANGQALSGLMQVGDYWIKETVTPGGYVSDSTPVKVTLVKNEIIEQIILNDAVCSIELTKTDSVTAAPIKGVKYGIFTDAAAKNPLVVGGVKVEGITDGSGKITFNNLEPDTVYYTKELATTGNYVLDTTVRAVTTAKGNAADKLTKVDYTNDRKGKLVVNKTTSMDSMNGQNKPMSGVKFNLYVYINDDTDYTKQPVVASGTTDSKGSLSFDYLTPKDYWLAEISVPAGEAGGYSTAFTGEKVTVTAGMNQTGYSANITDVVNVPVRGKFSINKFGVDGETKQAISATFTVYTDKTCKTIAKYSDGTDAILTTTNGTATSKWLSPADYYLKETGVTGNYTIDPAVKQFSITAGSTNTLSFNEVLNYSKGKISISKYAAFNIKGTDDSVAQYPLTGAKFNIYRKLTENALADVTGSFNEPVQSMDMTSATALSDYLDAGDYWLVEVKTPDDYTMSPSVGTKQTIDGKDVYIVNDPVTVTANSTTPTQVNVNNVTEKGKLRLFKRGFSLTGNLLDGAEFEVYRVDNEKGSEIAGGPVGVKLVKVNVSSSTNAGGSIMQSGTNGPGSAVTIDIDPGIYYLKETKAPADWFFDNPWSGGVEVTAGSESQTTIINYQMTGEGTKTDNNGKGLANAVLGAFSSETEATAMAAYIRDNNISYLNSNEPANAALVQYKKDIANKTFQNAHGILQTAKSDSTGKFVFKELVPGRTYYVAELLSPSGYRINENVYSVVVKDDGQGFVDGITIVNEALGHVQVTKSTKIGDITYTVEGVSFAVYTPVLSDSGKYTNGDKKYNLGTLVAQGVTDANGVYTSILLPAGAYIVVETSVEGAKGIVTMAEFEDTYKFVTVAPGKNNDGTAKYDYENPAVMGKFVLKKVTSPAGLTRNVEFTVYVKTDGEYVPYQIGGKPYTFKISTNTSAVTVSEYLPVGEYKLVETENKSDGLKTAADVEFKIEGGKLTGSESGDTAYTVGVTKDKPLIITNDRQGNISLIKYGQFTNNSTETSDIVPLKGVSFSLYKNATGDSAVDCADGVKPISTPVTDANGKITWTNLDAGNYWVKEVSLGSANQGKYTMDGTIKSVTVEKGKTAKVDTTGNIYNTTTYGKISIKKQDLNIGSPLAATFEVYKDADCKVHAQYMGATANAAIQTAAATGLGISGLLPAGTYYLKETVLPNGYTYDSDGIGDKIVYGPYVVEENKTLDATVNPILNRKLFTIEVTKKIFGKDSLKPDGVTIALYGTNQDAQNDTNRLDTQTTKNGEGKVTFKNLTIGSDGTKTYYYREVAVPAAYELNSAVKPVSINYTSTNTTATYKDEITNNVLGTITAEKIGEWQNTGDTDKKQVNLEGVQFSVYSVSGTGVKHSSGDKAVTTLTTGQNGKATSKGLPMGWYELVETKGADGYAVTADSYWVQVENNKDNSDLTGAGAVKNVPDKGRFYIIKYDGSKENPGTSIGSNRSAQFKLEQFNGTGWEIFNPLEAVFSVNKGGYTSGTLNPGKYRVTETLAPRENISNGVVDFVVDSTPIEFTVEAGKTVSVGDDGKVYNSPLGSIALTKYGHPNYGDAAKEVLAGAKFVLCSDSNGTQIDGTEQTTNPGGLCTWSGLKPGDYWIKELESSAMAQKGYAINTGLKKVTVAAGKRSTDNLVNTAEVYNESNQGKMLILKQDEKGTALDGAEFKIYAPTATGYSTTPIDTVTVSGGKGYSKLLDASATGTKYKVVETKAPSGFTLNDSISKLSAEVTVYPLHNPSQAKSENMVTFTNKKVADVVSLVKKIQKTVSDDNETDKLSVSAEDSLLKSEYTAKFTLGGYTDGKNQVGAESFTVTDNNVALHYYENSDYVKMTAKDDDYRFTSVNVLAAKNGNTSEKVTANIYYQTSLAEKASDTWTLYQAEQNLDLTGDKLVSFPDSLNIIGVRVEYKNIKESFTANGIELTALFRNRASTSTSKDHEVRKITNSAELSWKDSNLDSDGNVNTGAQNKSTVKSNDTEILIPLYENKIPQVSIKAEKKDVKNTFYSGETVNYIVTATNHEVAGQNEEFRSPVMSMVMPALTNLSESQYQKGFLVYAKDKNGKSTVIPASRYSLMKTSIYAPLADKGNDNYETSDKIMSNQYVFSFTDDVVLQPGEMLVVEFAGVVNYDPKTPNNVASLVMPSYLSSSKLVPVSVENPLGLSFSSFENKQIKHDNGVIDGEVSENLQYLNQTVTVTVLDSTSTSVLKEVGYKNAKGELIYNPVGTNASVNSNENVYYRITVMNNSTQNIEKARLVDIFPFNGDTYVMSSGGAFTERGTNIPGAEGYEGMTLLDVKDSGGKATLYSTDRSWRQRSNSELGADGVLGAMYYRNKTFGDNSQWSAGYSGNSTALGIELDFAGDFLAPGESYQLEIEMKTPSYTADKISDYKDKIMANSVMLSVLAEGETADAIDVKYRVEPNMVAAEVALLTGEIGDYVWYDENGDGIQGADERKAEGVKVNLMQNTHRSNIDGNEVVDSKLYKSTVTNQDGLYLFKDLPCNYLKEGAPQDSTNVDDYVGKEYYTYSVNVVIPEGYTATKQYVGDDRAVDSNINPKGEMEEVPLRIYNNEKVLSGESNLTMDAGLVYPYSLGDFVWLDSNNNGIQDIGESGVKGVPVFVYAVDGPDGTVKEGDNYIARTTTDENGAYIFKNLRAGYYVVEFDISGLRKADGYTFSYDFTKAIGAAGEILATDSDAKNPVDADGRIKRTDVVELTAESIGRGNLTDNTDPRWDAGLVVYSAIGGFCFDDVDYNDIHTLNVPLPGTSVELYEVNGGKRADKPAASTVVGDNGKYYFDHLVFDGTAQDYQLRFVFPKDYTGVDANVGDDNTIDSDVLYDSGSKRTEGLTEIITLQKDSVDTTWDAGARKYGAIGDYIWRDADKNGRQDIGEEPVPDVRVVLQSRLGENKDWVYCAETKTDDKGFYCFEQLKGGANYPVEYRVVFAFDSTINVTECQASGVSAEQDSDAINTYVKDAVPADTAGNTGGYVTRPITIGYGQRDMTWDAGIVTLYSAIGDFVWYDDDYNGIQSSADVGVANIPVALEFNPSGKPEEPSAWQYFGTVYTDSQGRYLFDKLNAGYYRVRFQVPDGYTITKYNQTADTAVDSDAMIRSQERWYYTKNFYLAAGVTDLSWDTGIYKPKVTVINKPKIVYNTTNSPRTGDTETTDTGVWMMILSGTLLIGLLARKTAKARRRN